MNGLTITKRNGGLGRRAPAGDMISGLVTSGVAVTNGAQLNTNYRLQSTADAASLLIDKDYDETNSLLVYEHINEFFRVNPNGTLYIMIVAQTVAYADLVDKEENYAHKLAIEANGTIKQMSVSYQPTTPVADFTYMTAVIAKAQELATALYVLHQPVEIILEGVGYDYSTPVDFAAQNAPNVSIMVGQSLSVARRSVSAATPYTQYAAVGTVLGAVSRAAVNAAISWVNPFNMQGGTLLSAGISNTPLTDISQGDLNTIDEDAGLFFRTHIGRAGFYFNHSRTATAFTSDYAYIENNRTIHKATRAIREILLGRLSEPIVVDGTTGQLAPEVIKSFEADGRRALEGLLSNDEVSALDVYVDPAQNILATSELAVNFSIVPTGSARNINVSIGFENPFTTA